jgi:heme-degrading monooxygenase HmoA
MAVLVTSFVPGLSRQQYEKTPAVLTDRLKAAPGFIAHYAWERGDGMDVVEIWESAEQHDDWFDNTVRPHLSAKVAQEKHDLINMVAP